MWPMLRVQNSPGEFDADDISGMFPAEPMTGWPYPVPAFNETEIAIAAPPVFAVDENDHLLVNGDVAEYPEELKEESLLPIVGWTREDETHSFVTFMLPTGKLVNATVETSQFEALANGDALSLQVSTRHLQPPPKTCHRSYIQFPPPLE
eukprot:GHVT01087759.1.p1 GENE.GHVT01087759.1~~GHVT01087759.1.p1  ORF type:complete len:150 (+),score=19.46 GHVT01087759.1:114-563(+)